MSNCIRLMEGTGKISFNKEEFNIYAFEKMYRDKIKNEGDWNLWQWFLVGNWIVIDEKLTINLGGSKSTHTWRDFDRVLEELTQFIRKEKEIEHTFIVLDEADGFQNPDIYRYTLGQHGFSDGVFER